MNFLPISPGHTTTLAEHGTFAESVHVFDQAMIDAVDTALAAGRPLLVRGEPGTGKSQLARAAAKELDRAFFSKVVDARTEARDLLWHFDAVARLGEAQLLGALRNVNESGLAGVRDELAEWRFVTPEALWWAFDWASGKELLDKNKRGSPPFTPLGWEAEKGAVVLIDEIDKAESDVPNGLLEALGDRRFAPPRWPEVKLKGITPLVVITTNEERALPDAFVRRCVVLVLEFPERGVLVDRAKKHFPALSEKLFVDAVDLLIAERKRQIGLGLTPPGQAEYLDLLRALDAFRLRRGDAKEAPETLLQRIAGYALRKHREQGSGQGDPRP